IVTAPDRAMACSTGFVRSTVFSNHLQFVHHSAEKSTSTVWPSTTATCLSHSSENGCQATSFGLMAMRYSTPKDTPTNARTTAPAIAQDFTRSANSEVSGVREMSQQATPIPSSNTSVGTTAIVSIN